MENINVDAKEVIDWVTQRRKLKADWNQKLKALENKAQTVIDGIKQKSIPELEDVFKGKDDQKVDYLLLKEIEEGLIRSPEGESKNFFGQYKSQHIKDIQALMRLYEKEFLHFAGFAHNLVQLVTYDIPFCRKVVKSNQNSIKDLEYKISAYESSIGNATREILKLVTKYDPETNISDDEIDQFNINDFIDGFIRTISTRIGSIEEKLSSLNVMRIVDYYTRFASYNNGALNKASQFSLLETLKSYGDIPLADFQNNNSSKYDQNAKSDLYNKLLKSKGFGGADIVFDDQEWEIEDLDNVPQDGKESNVPNMINSKNNNLETIITNRDTREEILESLYEVIL